MVTGKVRLSYVNLFEPRAQNGGEPKYSVTVLVPKSDTVTMQNINAAIETAVQEGIAKKWNGQRPSQISVPIYDGDGRRPKGEEFGPECRGHWVFTASSRQPPQVVDQRVQRIMDRTQVYSGMYGYVSLNFFPYNSNGNRGVGVGLGNVQKVADGEPLGGRRSADQEFTSIEASQTAGYGALAPQQPGLYQAQTPAYAPQNPTNGYAPAPNAYRPQPGAYQEQVSAHPTYASPTYDPPKSNLNGLL